MNADERAQLPPPSGCLSCQQYTETQLNSYPPRHGCLSGHPMHEMCGWRVPKTAPITGARN